MRSYEEIKKEIVDIGGVVDMLPENIKEKAFDLLISTFIGDKSDSNNQKSISNPSRNTSYILDNIAEITNDGNFKFIVRDPKAKNKKDAAKRLIYVAI